MTPGFSIVIPTLQRAAVLPRAIESVLRQTRTDLELIVVDDGSTDGTEAVVHGFQDPRLSYYFQPRSGVSAARNAGAARASGSLLCFLDSDDQSEPTWLEKLGAAFDADHVGLVFCGVNYIEGESPPAGITVLPANLGPLYHFQTGLFLAGSFSLPLWMFRAVGGYATALRYSENTELGIRLIHYCLQRGLQTRHLSEPLLRIHKLEPERRETAETLDARIDAASYLLAAHAELFRNHPAEEASYCAVAGVSAARLGRTDEARRFLARAVRRNPLRLRHIGRFLACQVPPLRHRLWPRVSEPSPS